MLGECNKYGDFVHQYHSGFHEVVVCGKINKDPDDDLEELRQINFKESERE